MMQFFARRQVFWGILFLLAYCNNSVRAQCPAPTPAGPPVGNVTDCFYRPQEVNSGVCTYTETYKGFFIDVEFGYFLDDVGNKKLCDRTLFTDNADMAGATFINCSFHASWQLQFIPDVGGVPVLDGATFTSCDFKVIFPATLSNPKILNTIHFYEVSMVGVTFDDVTFEITYPIPVEATKGAAISFHYVNLTDAVFQDTTFLASGDLTRTSSRNIRDDHMGFINFKRCELRASRWSTVTLEAIGNATVSANTTDGDIYGIMIDESDLTMVNFQDVRMDFVGFLNWEGTNSMFNSSLSNEMSGVNFRGSVFKSSIIDNWQVRVHGDITAVNRQIGDKCVNLYIANALFEGSLIQNSLFQVIGDNYGCNDAVNTSGIYLIAIDEPNDGLEMHYWSNVVMESTLFECNGQLTGVGPRGDKEDRSASVAGMQVRTSFVNSNFTNVTFSAEGTIQSFHFSALGLNFSPASFRDFSCEKCLFSLGADILSGVIAGGLLGPSDWSGSRLTDTVFEARGKVLTSQLALGMVCRTDAAYISALTCLSLLRSFASITFLITCLYFFSDTVSRRVVGWRPWCSTCERCSLE